MLEQAFHTKLSQDLKEKKNNNKSSDCCEEKKKNYAFLICSKKSEMKQFSDTLTPKTFQKPLL